jgi:phosphoribosylcarboxyaminoimidazole (NCAIR) mutase
LRIADFGLRILETESIMKEIEERKNSPFVGIVMGSDSDWGVMQEAASVLKQLGIPLDVTVSSAHRSPERTADYARSARTRGLKVIIAGAGAAAHLAGSIAALTTLPVIGVPIDSSSAILAAQILATTDPQTEARLERFKEKLASQVAQKAETLREKL